MIVSLEKPRCFRLATKGRYRCLNLIIHPNFRLYGDAAGLSCREWCEHEGKIIFLDSAKRVRFIFQRHGLDSWINYGMPQQTAYGQFQDMALAKYGQVILFTPPSDYEMHPQVIPEDKGRFEIVVAKYTEDVTWADAFLPNMTIYSKDPKDEGQYPILANYGREGGTYFHHILIHYENLADRTLFLQGDPFPHPLRAAEEYYLEPDPFVTAKIHTQSMEWTMPWSASTQRVDRDVMRAFLELLECNPTVSHFEWTQGAQFALSREQIQKRTRAYYQKLFDISQQPWITLAGRRFDNHHVAWLYELFWRNIFLNH